MFVMQPRVIRTLSEADVISRWIALYVSGKHAGHRAPDASHYIGRDRTWVEVEVPHELYNADWNTEDPDISLAQVQRASKYASTPGPLPPGMAGFKGRRLKGKVFVTDGNHRAFAAHLRGEPAARFYMPANEWERFKSTLE